ncbi:hypothetical protein AAHA92_19555 [Salvia divinorum]|uniref:Uncharacterized protein n=1 Tax=Salvia divinorum TaxID=28513 RepID=A0ABD1H5R6_SALDI
MESCSRYPHAPRAAAMAMAVVSAIVLSPLYVDGRLESRWSSSGLVLPAVVAGLIIAIKSTASASSSRRGCGLGSGDSDSFGIGGSSLGLAGILILLVFVLTWQQSVQRFLWR